ncbi:hypothetical protein [Vibrio parahaemolyticus]|uniref:hypothetical protein n=1 Tax=Vibrio parahaemolyticus TaxID=670 RepID=UPI00226A3F43|nr:hypothetical protein [Vibrio parahaemolyticus]MCX8895591.1 hypothetical protein [Vibrio parahaemolyticus]
MSFKNILLLTAITGALGSTSALAGPSAKFAATWSTNPAQIVALNFENYDTNELVAPEKHGHVITTLKVPQDKELLIGVSAEIGIVTDTSVKGKDGALAKAIADGRATVVVTATPVGGGVEVEAVPGEITLSQRIQEMSATLAGVIETCELSVEDTDADGVSEGTLDVSEDCDVSDEEIGLMQDTLASHHFNFILPNMDAGEYDIKAYFTTKADVDATAEELAEASAYAKVFVGKTMVTVQQVRAAANGLSEFDIVE